MLLLFIVVSLVISSSGMLSGGLGVGSRVRSPVLDFLE
jgi:hypothetical protein